MGHQRFAAVTSLDVAFALDSRNVLPTYHLLLAHKVLERPSGFRMFYRNLRMNVSGTFIIMDNGAAELDKPLPAKDVLEAVQLTMADVLILPDVMGDYQETIGATFDGYHEVLESKPEWCSLMAVMQGKTNPEVERCYQAILQYMGDDLRYIALPRLLTKHLGTREHIVKKLGKGGRGKDFRPIHLLGFSNDIEDDIRSARQPGVMGIDSAVPIRWGMDENIIYQNSLVPPRHADYLDHPGTNLPEEVIENMRIVKRWLSE